MKLGMEHLGLWSFVVYINHDLGLTLTYKTVNLNRKVKYCQKDLNVIRYRQFMSI